MSRTEAVVREDGEEIELGPAPAPRAGIVAAGDAAATARKRERLAAVAGFLFLFHLVFALFQAAGPSGSSDAATSSLALRAAAAAAVFVVLRSPIAIGRRGLPAAEVILFGGEMLLLLLAQYRTGIALIDAGQLVDAVALQKNGVLRTLVLMLCGAIFVPHHPAVTARISITMAAALVVCHALVLQHAAAAGASTMDLVADEHVVMANALFLVMGSMLAAFAARVLRGGATEVAEGGRIGPYRLLRTLDEGGMGEVFLAEHEFLGRVCAVKLVRAARRRDPADSTRFEDEARAAALVRHPASVTVFDAGRTADGIPYCAMEYLPGLSVAALVRRFGPLPPGRAVHLARQVCGALADAHRLGLVHGDLSPSNVFVSVLGGECDVAKVLDFAAASAPAARLEGTPEYVAPEQAVRGAAVDGRADLYGVGALLHYMLTAAPPFERGSAAEVLRAHVADPVPGPRSRRPDLPADLDAVVRRCLAKRPADRPADARDLARALAACACAADWDGPRAEAWWREHVGAADGADADRGRDHFPAR